MVGSKGISRKDGKDDAKNAKKVLVKRRLESKKGNISLVLGI